MERIKKMIEKNKNKKSEVADLLYNVRKTQDDPEVINALSIRMSEFDSLIQVTKAALETEDRDESFYREHLGRFMYLLERRFEDITVMVDALVDASWKEKAAKKETIEAVA